MTYKSFPNFLEIVAICIFGIILYSVLCEKLFSTLDWFINSYHTNLSISQVKAMSNKNMSIEEMINLLTDLINNKLDKEEDEENVDINLRKDLELVINIELNIITTLNLNTIIVNDNINLNEDNNQEVNLENEEDFDLKNLVDKGLKDFE
ncbi:10776_t:CDS:2 [Funneliformis caledonium]|uniref:10776_t:CDS:1 n=1 Tax=Funneliformis caledonium TaxID=1117310 RepID=A0A9N8WLP8_9GLOM|nr:10776_t:CDS:2 [Funneliformis caledonium]